MHWRLRRRLLSSRENSGGLLRQTRNDAFMPTRVRHQLWSRQRFGVDLYEVDEVLNPCSEPHKQTCKMQLLYVCQLRTTQEFIVT
jgi:hypothetical protein